MTVISHLFSEQIKYISPSLWLFQFITVIFVAAFAAFQAEGADEAAEVLFRISPLVSVMAVPELIKDMLCNMSELEKSCKNSGSMILVMRLIAVGMINVLVLCMISGVLAGVYHLHYFELLLQQACSERYISRALCC